METHIKFDWAIKRLLRQKANFAVLEGFLSVLLEDDIKISEIIESESNQESIGEKFNKVDLLIKNSKGEHIIVEIQNERENDFFHRMQYGQGKIISERMKLGDRYGALKKVVSIAIVYFNLGEGEDYVYKGTTQFKGIHNNDTLQLDRFQRKVYPDKEIDELFTTYYILKVNNFNEQAKDSLDEWVYFLKNSNIPLSFTAQGLPEARDKMRVESMSDYERENYYNFMKMISIKEGELESAILEGRMEGEDIGRQEGIRIGIEKGIEQGIEKGLEQGIEKGLEQGIEKGIEKEKREVAKKLLSRDVPEIDIALITGLDIEIIRNIKAGK